MIMIHAFTSLRTLGGVQSVLRRHLAEDERWGLRSWFITFFEPDDSPEDRVRGLGLTWRHTIRHARPAFRRAVQSLAQPRIIGYYNFWGMPFLASEDQAHRRIGVLHTDWPGLARCLGQVKSLVDGVICVSRPLLEVASRVWPELGDRLILVPCPIDSPASAREHPPLEGHPIVLGFCGRIAREQKRVDRFPALYRELTQAGLDFRLEFLGDGPQKAWLQRRFGSHPNVVFHGRLAGPDYWRAITGWDAIVFVSDYEGIPLALLEAMSVGVVPIYPRIGCGGGEYVRRAAEPYWYEAGDLAGVARAVRQIKGLTHPVLAELRYRCWQVVQPHLGDGYFKTFSQFVREIAQRPRLGRERFPPRRLLWSDWCPFGLLRRVYPHGFWQNDEL